MSIFIVLAMYALWSSCFSLGKVALAISPPLFLTASRMILASLILLSFIVWKDRKSLKIDKKTFLLIALLGLSGIYLTNALEFWSLQYLTAAKTCFIYSLCPFFSALFSYIHFKEKMTPKKWLGLSIGLVGILPVLGNQKGSSDLFTSFFSWPELAMFAAAITTVYGWILMRLVLKKNQTTPLATNGLSMLIGGSFALIHSLMIDSWTPLPIPTQQIGSFTSSILWMTFISNIVCYNLYGMMLKRFTATFLSFMGLLSPIFASLTSWILLGETPSLSIFLSTGIVSIGAWLVYSAELKQGYTTSSLKQEETPASS